MSAKVGRVLLRGQTEPDCSVAGQSWGVCRGADTQCAFEAAAAAWADTEQNNTPGPDSIRVRVPLLAAVPQALCSAGRCNLLLRTALDRVRKQHTAAPCPPLADLQTLPTLPCSSSSPFVQPDTATCCGQVLTAVPCPPAAPCRACRPRRAVLRVPGSVRQRQQPLGGVCGRGRVCSQPCLQPVAGLPVGAAGKG